MSTELATQVRRREQRSSSPTNRRRKAAIVGESCGPVMTGMPTFHNRRRNRSEGMMNDATMRRSTRLVSGGRELRSTYLWAALNASQAWAATGPPARNGPRRGRALQGSMKMTSLGPAMEPPLPRLASSRSRVRCGRAGRAWRGGLSCLSTVLLGRRTAGPRGVRSTDVWTQ